jgi:lipid-A-disaccharide synthase
MPGSRWQEVERFGPTLLDAARSLGQRHPDMRFVLPLAGPHLRDPIQRQVASADLTGRLRLVHDEVYTWLSRCDLALVSSGTATLELAILGVPMVTFYRLHPLTYLAARLVVTSRYVSLPNILLDAAVVPELIQGDFTSARLIVEAERILADPARAAAMRKRFADLRASLGTAGVLDAAAGMILDELSPIRAVDNVPRQPTSQRGERLRGARQPV